MASNILKKLRQLDHETVLDGPMRMVPERVVFTVSRHEGVWHVEQDGQQFGHSREKEVAKAAAHRQAREMMDAGRACEVRVSGERGLLG